MRDRLGVTALVAASFGLIGAVFALRGGPSDIVTPMPAEDFSSALESMVAAYATGQEIDGLPVVHPAPGDIYLRAERWRFYPALELEPGQRYRLHATSVDVVHSLVLGGRDRLLVPGQTTVIDIIAAPDTAPPQCAEFCGNGHYKMKGVLIVK